MKINKNALSLGLLVLGMVGMLFGLAKLANRTSATPEDLTLPVTAQEHFQGKADAPVTLVEYSDFQCPACRSFEPTLKRLLTEYDEEVKLVYRHFPLRSIHPNAQKAAEASEAAGLQGKFWEYHGVLFNTQDTWAKEGNPEALFVEYAKSLGLNEEQFKKDLQSDTVKNKVNNDAKSGEDAHLSGTPSFFLNGKFFPLPNSYEALSAAIVEQLIITGNNTVPSSNQ